MTPGDVALVHFPFSLAAEEGYKRRPVLVLSAVGSPPDRAVFCVMITSNERRVHHPGPGDIVIPDWRESGLRAPSVVRCRRIWTAEERDFPGSILGRVGYDVLSAVRDEVSALLGVSDRPPVSD